MPTLADFQAEASQALNDPKRLSPQVVNEKSVDGLSRRFNIYRNNRAGSLTDALQSTYPILHKLTGDTFFRAAARQFIDISPPTGPVLNEYGEMFGQFMQRLPGTSKYPYLEDVAQLEWQRLRAFHASDQESLSMDDLQSVDPFQLASYSLAACNATRLVKSEWAIGSLYESISTDSNANITLKKTENVLITRPGLNVQMQLIDVACTVFFEHLLYGSNIAEAATEAISFESDFNTGAQLNTLMRMGTFSHISN